MPYEQIELYYDVAQYRFFDRLKLEITSLSHADYF